MATYTKANPVLVNESRSFLGKTIKKYTIDFAVNGTDFSDTEMGGNGAVQAVITTVITKIQENANIVLMSALRADAGSNAGQLFDVYLEHGDAGTTTYDGANSETFIADLEDRIQALNPIGAGAVNLGSATVAAVTDANGGVFTA